MFKRRYTVHVVPGHCKHFWNILWIVNSTQLEDRRICSLEIIKILCSTVDCSFLIYSFLLDLVDYRLVKCCILIKKSSSTVFHLVGFDDDFHYIAELHPLLFDKLCCCDITLWLEVQSLHVHTCMYTVSYNTILLTNTCLIRR